MGDKFKMTKRKIKKALKRRFQFLGMSTPVFHRDWLNDKADMVFEQFKVFCMKGVERFCEMQDYEREFMRKFREEYRPYVATLDADGENYWVGGNCITTKRN